VESLNLSKTEATELIERAKRHLVTEAQLLEISSKRVVIIGDTHGDYNTSKKAADTFLGREDTVLLFLGDYVDRGPKQIENINFLLNLKTEVPNRIYLIRGNHETPTANLNYGFFDLVSSKYSVGLYRKYSELFAQMPYAAVLGSSILCVHGGLAEGLTDLEQIASLPKGEVDPVSSLVMQLLWNDPREGISGFERSFRGEGIRYFGRDVFDIFMKENKLSLMLRAHEAYPEGYAYLFDGRLLGLFSCRYYGVTPRAAVLDESGGQRGLSLVDLT